MYCYINLLFTCLFIRFCRCSDRESSV